MHINKISRGYSILYELVAEKSERSTFNKIDHDFPSLTIEEVKEKLGRKFFENAKALLVFADEIESSQTYDKVKGKYCEIQISVYDKKLKRIFKTASTISRIIEKAKAAKMLHEVNSQVKWGSSVSRYKTFIYNAEARTILEEILAEKSECATRYSSKEKNECATEIKAATRSTSKSYMRLNDDAHALKNECATLYDIYENNNKSFLYSEGIRNSFECILKPASNPPWFFRKGHFGRRKATDSEVIMGLQKSYPWLAYYSKKVDILNRYLPPVLKLKFEPKITRGKSGCISGVSIRATSKFCQSKKGRERDEILKALGMEGASCYDVPSSIYRVEYGLNFGEWLPDTFDFYTQMMPADCPYNREQYKTVAQRLHFTDSPSESFSKAKLSSSRYLNGARRYRRDKFNEGELAFLFNLWEGMFKSMRELIGSTRGSEIFLHESCLYIDLLCELMGRGYRVAQVYDSCYSDAPDLAGLCQSLLPMILKNYLKLTGINTHRTMYDLEIKNKITESIEGEFPEDEKAVESPSKFAWAMMPEDKPEEATAVNQPSEVQKPAEAPEELNREALEEVIRAATSDAFSDKPMMEKKEEDVMDVINSLEYRVADSKIDSGQEFELEEATRQALQNAEVKAQEEEKYVLLPATKVSDYQSPYYTAPKKPKSQGQQDWETLLEVLKMI